MLCKLSVTSPPLLESTTCFTVKKKPLEKLIKTRRKLPLIIIKLYFGKEQLAAFRLIKDTFSKDIILRQPYDDDVFYVECYASDYAIGSVESQKDPKTGSLRPLEFFLENVSDHEINYDVYDKELYSIVKTFEQYRYLLIGTQEPVIVYSDHLNFKYFTTTKTLNRARF